MTMHTVLEVVKRTTEFFEGKGVESPRLNAELLVGHALGLKRMQLYLQFERPLTEPELERIRPLVRRRAAREPLQYVLGEAAFRDLTLGVDPRVLIPRPETERLVELVLQHRTTTPATVLDLGTGSGAIALSLARAWPEARVTAVDCAEGALAVAAANAVKNSLEGCVHFMRSDWFAALPAGARYDVIVANPPYLAETELAGAEPEVRDHEPRSALTSGPDAAADLRAIIAEAPRWLAPGGLLALETGIGQHQELLAAAQQVGFPRAESLRDLAGRDRFVLAFL
jgi:release factor glutamine methyltransferase